jgi:hypothetical protein
MEEYDSDDDDDEIRDAYDHEDDYDETHDIDSEGPDPSNRSGLANGISSVH